MPRGQVRACMLRVFSTCGHEDVSKGLERGIERKDNGFHGQRLLDRDGIRCRIVHTMYLTGKVS